MFLSPQWCATGDPPTDWNVDSLEPLILVDKLPRYWFSTANPVEAHFHGVMFSTSIGALVEFRRDDDTIDSARNLLLSTSRYPDIPTEHNNVVRRPIGDYTRMIARYYDEEFDALSWIAWRRPDYSTIVMSAVKINDNNPDKAIRKLFEPFLNSLEPCKNWLVRIDNKLLDCQL